MSPGPSEAEAIVRSTAAPIRAPSSKSRLQIEAALPERIAASMSRRVAALVRLGAEGDDAPVPRPLAPPLRFDDRDIDPVE